MGIESIQVTEFLETILGQLLATILVFFYFLLKSYRNKFMQEDLELKVTKRFTNICGGHPEISELKDILNEIKINKIPEHLWDYTILSHKMSESEIQKKMGRGRLK